MFRTEVIHSAVARTSISFFNFFLYFSALMLANVGVGCSTCDRSLTLSPWGRATESGPGHWLLGWWWSTQRVSGGAFSCRRRTAACCCRLANIHLQEKTKQNRSKPLKKRTEKKKLGLCGILRSSHTFLCCNKPSLCALVSPDWTYFHYIILYTITTTTFQLQQLQLGH